MVNGPPGAGPAGGPGPGPVTRRTCREIASDFARRKSIASGKLVEVFDVGIAQWSIRNSSNARFAGGIPTRNMIAGDRELYDSSLSGSLCSTARRTGMMIMTKTHYYVRENTVL